MKKQHITFALVLFISAIQAQTKNIFFERSFWQEKPTIELVEQKIEEGNSAIALNPNGFDSVTYAILANAPNKTIKHLLTKKGNGVNKITHDKRTYVFWAAYKNNVEIMKHLIANNARMDLKDSHQLSPLTFAANAGQTNKEIYELCIQNGIDIKTDVDEHGANALLLVLPSLKNLSFAKYLTSKGLSLHSVDSDGNGAFNYAAKKGNKKMLELLIKKGLPYKKLNKKGGNAILLATQGSRSGYNTLKFFKYLESLGIKPNITNKEEKTPLHNLARGNKDSNTFNYFLDKGVNANQVDDNGNTSLIIAASRNSLEIVQLLSEKTKNINHTNKKGNSALTYAVEYNSETVVDYLVKNKANIQVKDANENSLAYYLIKSYHPKKVNDFNEKMSLLANNGLNLTQLQANNNTLFHIAVEKNSIDLLKKVNTLKIDVNAKNSEGLTPLHLAAMQANNTKVIKYLLSIGANKSITTDFDETVHDLAKENEILNKKKIDISFLK
ncbi:ankyrin repeat domain-containing protein [Tenacibaculum sp. SDUM215027]|uniref:ankyrin repeat domain-containing protein n=1 Tax=Tenacibaculum sp. SDUM215027 TaxID=3422596 RepID=UPI003D319BAA